MIINIVDLETTGLDPAKDEVTEIGAILWDTDLNAPVAFFNKLLRINGKLEQKIIELTGITDDLLAKHGELPEKVWKEYSAFCAHADFMLAHNAPFDRGFIEAAIGPELRPWIDSCTDVDYPETITTRKLTYLAAEHGFANPFAHRAITDVLTTAQIVSRYDWNETIKNAQTPSITLRAMVTYEQNQKAKDLSFRWDATRKIWTKQVKEHRVENEIKKSQDHGFLAKRIG